jgi:hypothetical protein
MSSPRLLGSHLEGPQRSRAVLALAAAGLLAACASRPPPAEPLTSVDVSGAIGLFAIQTPGLRISWYRLLADGSFRSAATQGTVVPTWVPGPDNFPTRKNLTIPFPVEMFRISTDLVLVRFGSADTTDPVQPYLQQGQVLNLRSGRIDEGWSGAGILRCTGYPGCTWPAWTSQPMGDGTLAVLSLDPDSWPDVTPGSIYSTALVGSTWTERWPLTPQLRTTDLFAVDAAGNMAIRGLVSGGPPTFIPAVGPMVESPLGGTFGDFWTGPDGAIRATRLVGDAAGTVELIRFDLSATGQVTATATASWTGTGLLTGWPTTMGPSTVFMVGTQPLVFDTPDATPALHPALGITWTQLQATTGALWFTAGTREAGYLVRWTRAGSTELRPTAPSTYYEIFPIADDDVLIGAWDPVGGKSAVLRSNGISAPTLIDLGDSPALRGHVRW